MSQENVEVVERAITAWNAGDIDAVRDCYDPDAILRAPPGWPEPGPFVDRDAVIQQLVQTREAFARDWIEVVSEFRGSGDRIIVRVDWRGTGSGPESNFVWTLVFTVRKGRIFAQEFFWDHAEALEAVGLSE